MAHYDATSAKVLVFTFKEGLLSAMAHDLKLEVTRFSVDDEGGVVKGDFDAGSLKVVAPMKDGQENPSALPKVMYGEIEKNVVKDVLVPKKHPRITFASTAVSDTEVQGQLTLNGVTKPVRGARRDEGGQRVAEFKLDQRDFGIKPFTAMLGALKIKPEVLVRIALPA